MNDENKRPAMSLDDDFVINGQNNDSAVDIRELFLKYLGDDKNLLSTDTGKPRVTGTPEAEAKVAELNREMDHWTNEFSFTRQTPTVKEEAPEEDENDISYDDLMATLTDGVDESADVDPLSGVLTDWNASGDEAEDLPVDVEPAEGSADAWVQYAEEEPNASYEEQSEAFPEEQTEAFDGEQPDTSYEEAFAEEAPKPLKKKGFFARLLSFGSGDREESDAPTYDEPAAEEEQSLAEGDEATYDEQPQDEAAYDAPADEANGEVVDDASVDETAEEASFNVSADGADAEEQAFEATAENDDMTKTHEQLTVFDALDHATEEAADEAENYGETAPAEEYPAEAYGTEDAPAEEYTAEEAETDDGAADASFDGEADGFLPEEGNEAIAENESVPDEAANESDAEAYGDTVMFDRESEAGDTYAEETPATDGEPADEAYPDEYAEAADEEAHTVDETDANLMVAFGMEDELEKKVGKKKSEKIQANLGHTHECVAREPVEMEFTDRGQIPAVVEAYKHTRRWLLVKLGIAAALLLYLLFYENISIFGIQFSGMLDPKVYPAVYIMVGLQPALFACAAAYEQLLKGFKKLFTGRPSAESLLAGMFLFDLIYTVVLMLTTKPGADSIQLFNAPLALTAVIALLHDYLCLKREMYSFNVVSSKRPKYVLRRLTSAEAPEESAVLEGTGDILKIEKVDFVDGFFSRSYTSDTRNSATILFLTAVIPFASVMMGLMAAYLGDGDPMRAAGMTFSAAYPVALLLLYSYPFFRASKMAYEADSTVVGECSLDEYADGVHLAVDESLAFADGDVKVRNIRVYNNYRIDKVLYFAASLFSKTGSALGKVFSVAAGDLGRSDDVKLLECHDGIVMATVDGRTVTFGQKSTLLAAGFPDVMADEPLPDDPEMNVLYMFREDILVAELYVKYTLSTEFDTILREAVAAGMTVSVRSFDPGISEELMDRCIDRKAFPLLIVKPKELPGRDGGRTDSGIVTRGAAANLLATLPLCGKVLDVRRTGESIGWASVLMTLVASALISALGAVGAVGSLAVCLYQLLWAVPALLLASSRLK